MSMRRENLRRLRPGQVRQIRAMKKEGYTYSALSHRFGLSVAAVRRIIDLSSYKDIT